MSVDDGLRVIFRKHLPQFDWCTVESGTTGRGIPDSNYCARKSKNGHSDGVEGWIEYKATSAWAVTLRPEQVGWIARRTRYGGRVYIAVRRRHTGGKRLGAAVDQLWLFKGVWAARAKQDGLRGAWTEMAEVWHGGPTRWDWDAVARTLTS